VNVTEQSVIDIVYGVIDEINERSGGKKRLEKTLDYPLFGEAGNLDSMDLVNFIVDIEQGITRAFGTPVSLANERSLSQTRSPFRTLGTLVDYIVVLLNDGQ